MTQTTYWKPIAVNTLLKLGFPDFKDYYKVPLFIRVNKDGTKDKREIIAVGCDQLPAAAKIVLEDYVIPDESEQDAIDEADRLANESDKRMIDLEMKDIAIKIPL